jgi:hypothetical protein
MKLPWYKWFTATPWNIFDVLVNFAVIIPLSAPSTQPLGFLRAARLLRTALILREVQAIAPDLSIVISALGSSVYSLGLVAFLILVFILLCAMAATLLFKSANPYNFGSKYGRID